jgi:hypothetical protein
VTAWDARGPHPDPVAAVEDHLRSSWRSLAGEASLLEAASDALGADRLAELPRAAAAASGRTAGAGPCAGALAADVALSFQVRTWFALVHEAGREHGDDGAQTEESPLVRTLLRALGADGPP